MLSVKNRLRKKKDFENVFKNGKTAYGRFIGIKKVENELKINRFGLIISTKVSKKAVIRNKIRRQLRSILHSSESRLEQGNDLIVICLKTILESNFEELESEIQWLLKKLKVYK